MIRATWPLCAASGTATIAAQRANSGNRVLLGFSIIKPPQSKHRDRVERGTGASGYRNRTCSQHELEQNTHSEHYIATFQDANLEAAIGAVVVPPSGSDLSCPVPLEGPPDLLCA